MVETFIIDWPVLALIGVVFGAFASERDWWRSRAFMGGVVSALVFTAVAVASYFVAPDWMWMYFIQPSRASWAVPLIPVAYMFTFLLGFAASVGLRRASRAAVWGSAAACVLLEVAVIALTWDRYRLVGTKRAWLEGTAHELFSTAPTGPVRTIGLLAPAFFVVAAAALVWVARQTSRRRTAWTPP